MWRATVFLVAVACCLQSRAIDAATILPGFRVDLFADVTDPLRMTVDSSGNIYVGRSNNGSGGLRTDPVRIHRISPSGVVEEFGHSAIQGPAAVLFHVNGIMGVADSILVGGVVTSPTSLYAIQPNQDVVSLLGPTTSIPGPSDMAFDRNGRLVYIAERGSVFTSTGGVPTKLFDVPSNGRFLAIDADNRIFTSTSDGTIRVYDSSGTLLNGNFATGLGSSTSLAFGPGGAWGTDLYAMANGTLYRFESNGNAAVFGTGLVQDVSSYLLFHPDGTLYISDFAGDRILRVSAVPEPSTGAMLLGLGVTGILAQVRRRKR